MPGHKMIQDIKTIRLHLLGNVLANMNNIFILIIFL